MGIEVHQNAFVAQLINRNDVPYEQVDTPSTLTFFDPTPEDNPLNEEDQEIFTSLVMSLMYVAQGTRPDVLKEATFLSTKCSKPNHTDKSRLHRVLSYLHSYPKMSLSYKYRKPDEKFHIYAYSDASHLMHGDSAGSTGIVIFLDSASSPVVSKAHKQKLVTRSTAEAELLALDDTATYVVWLKNLLLELRQIAMEDRPIVYCDNEAALQMLKNGINFKKCKHFMCKFNFIRQCVALESFDMQHCTSEFMRADLYTKSFYAARFNILRDYIVYER